MKSQDTIIYETEMALEHCRKTIFALKSTLTNTDFILCCTFLENILFEFIVLFYTHRTIWTRPEFWSDYAKSQNPIEFSNSAYKEMMKSTLTNCYSKLYFCFEGGLYKYLKNQKIEPKETALKMLTQLDKTLIPNYDELKNGVNILRSVRNSFHGNGGNYIFIYPSEEIYFKGEYYKFQNGQPVSASYKFIRDFIPMVVETYRGLFIERELSRIESPHYV